MVSWCAVTAHRPCLGIHETDILELANTGTMMVAHKQHACCRGLSTLKAGCHVRGVCRYVIGGLLYNRAGIQCTSKPHLVLFLGMRMLRMVWHHHLSCACCVFVAQDQARLVIMDAVQSGHAQHWSARR
jgi:hypothetical protein